MKLIAIARSGWRPALGWVAVFAAFNEFVLRAWLPLYAADSVQTSAFVALVIAQIGIRAVEKIKGTKSE